MLGRSDIIEAVSVRAGAVRLHGTLIVPPAAIGVAILAHERAATRPSLRDRRVAEALRERGLATLRLDLETVAETAVKRLGGAHELELDVMAERLADASEWVARESHLAHLPIAYVGTTATAAATLIAAARKPALVRAVVVIGGRADLAGAALAAVHAPTLVVVGGAERDLLELSRDAIGRMVVHTQLSIVPGASHRFDEPGALDEVEQLAGEWIVGRFATSFSNLDPTRTVGRQFHDRRAAGERLARQLAHHAGRDIVVFGLPRSGMPVAHELARALNAPLDVWLVEKLGMPIHPELGMGALAEGAALVLDPTIARWSGASPRELAALVHREAAEIRRRARRYRGERPPRDIHGKTAILVDDSIASPSTLRAAIRGAKKRGAAQVVVAAPVAASDAVTALRREADEVACVALAHDLIATSAWYEHYPTVGDQEVVDILARAA